MTKALWASLFTQGIAITKDFQNLLISSIEFVNQKDEIPNHLNPQKVVKLNSEVANKFQVDDEKNLNHLTNQKVVDDVYENLIKDNQNDEYDYDYEEEF
jgi:hypothetical protein